MIIVRIVLWMPVWLALAGCAENKLVYRPADNAVTENQRLLVTFADQNINRNISGNPLDNYRVQDQYANSGWSRGIAVELADRHHLQIIMQWPMTELGQSCVVYEAADQEQLQHIMAELQQDSEVVSVQPMNSFNALSQSTIARANADPYLSLQNGYQSLGIGDLHAIATGRGVRIALIDSGVDADHPDLQGQIKYTQNLAPEPADHNLADVHGTAVAGVLSAKPDNGIGIAGIAPEAEVLALRACWPDKPGLLAARCNTFTLALAINQAIRLKSRIINLSLSGPEDPLLRVLVEKALIKGIVVIAAVPGKDQTGGFPANMSGVIAVGRGDEAAAPEVIAPGVDILTTVPHHAYEFMTGSSFATPHVAGMAALLLQLHPNWQTADIKKILEGGLSHISHDLLDTSANIAGK
jgi:subtilisin family serine protease